MVLDWIAELFCVEKGTLLVPFSILTSAFIGAGVALWAIRSNRKIARLKNSMDFINGFNEDESILQAKKEIAKLADTTTAEIQKFATSNGRCENTQNIRTVLNYYESMAICIHNNIYDNTIIQESVHTTVIDIWRICEPYVKERRKLKNNKDTIFQDLEKLATAWKRKPLKKIKR